MRINAYVMVSDPVWIQASVRSYYDLVDMLVVSYDASGLGWTGVKIPVQECLDRLKAIDHAGKIRLLEGHFARLDHTPMDNDLFQREQSLKLAQEGADWVLMFDTDEVLPQPQLFRERLENEVPTEFNTVDWPMRVIFQKLSENRYLEVCTRPFRRQMSEFSGPVAVRPNVPLRLSRFSRGRTWRFDFRRNLMDWTRCALGKNPHVHALIGADEAVWHFSYVRSEKELRGKLSSWGHSKDFDTEAYIQNIWLAAPTRWRQMRDFHPMHSDAWPALRPVMPPVDLQIFSP